MNRSTSDDGRDELDGIGLPSNAYELGVDERGATHYHSALDHCVWVAEDGEVTHEFDVDDIAHYEAHVADTRGWAETVDTGSDDLGEWLIDELEAMGVTA